MFVRKKKNKSGSVSVQILMKVGRKNKLLKTVGCAKTKREEDLLTLLANSEMNQIQGTQSLFEEHDDLVVDNFVNSIANNHLQIIGSELILGKIYQLFNFPDSGCPNYFRNNQLCTLMHQKKMIIGYLGSIKTVNINNLKL